MADVVDLKAFKEKKLDIVYSCECGTQLFYMNASVLPDKIGLECSGCGLVVGNYEVIDSGES